MWMQLLSQLDRLLSVLYPIERVLWLMSCMAI